MPPSQPIRAARGVRDVLPGERAAWAQVEQAAARVARSFGYQEIEVPIIEPAELVERMGEDTDVVAKEIYRFQDRGGRWLALRPEATAGVVRAYFEGGLQAGPQPARLYLLGPMFRYDRPQAGRYRQFHQLDVEAIGDPSPALDAEIIELAAGWLNALGLRDVRLELNSIGDSRCRPAYLRLLQDYYRPHKEKLHPDCQRRLETNPLRLLDCKEERCQPFKARAPRVTDHLCEPCQEAFSEVRGLLDAAGIEYQLNPFLVRGLDYYTRTVFEFQHEALGGAQNSLVGGGRYDGLASALNWPDTPAVGFAAGLERVLSMMKREGEEVVPAPAAGLLVLPAEPGLSVAAAQVARSCREAVATAVDYSERSLRAKMRAAAKAGARWVAIFNREEGARKVVQLREMTSGEQAEVAWADLPERLISS
ncbi:MAG TPA: histidine--tRNA ligase [Candidatus Acidoferrales bacterium]|nr:histidine--tRNA ligase [Candidatus Acidoferrales bacterium]